MNRFSNSERQPEDEDQASRYIAPADRSETAPIYSPEKLRLSSAQFLTPEADTSPRLAPYLLLFFLLAVFGCIVRFVRLESLPPGVFVDEQAAMANALCIIRNGTSLYHKPYPVYFTALGGFYDPIFIYSEVFFAKVFGASIASFRIFPSLCLLGACFGTAALAACFFGVDVALFAALTALFCPWSFHAGRLVWGSGVFPVFLTWGLYCLWRTRRAESEAGRPYLWAVSAGLLFACAMSLYRPANAVVLLLLFTLFVCRTSALAIRIRYLLSALGTIVICGIPNFLFVSGNGWGRIDSLSIFGKDHMAQLGGSYGRAVQEVLANYRLFLSWNFLFSAGDNIYRHTPAWGALGWPEAVGLFVTAALVIYQYLPAQKNPALTKKELSLIAFCCVGVIVGLFPACQSWDSNPHALRANGAWPFFVLLASVGLAKLFRGLRLGPMCVSLVFLIYIPVFLSHYFFTFPALAAPWFDEGLARTAKSAASSGDWSQFASIVKDYGRDGPSIFPMLYKGLDCNAALSFVDDLHPHAPRYTGVTIDYGVQAQPAPGAPSIAP
ncbi:MAG: hypothetical protein U0136_21340 [Bdellovibrionota bacterium]